VLGRPRAGKKSIYGNVTREASSMQTWMNSQPMPWWRLTTPGSRPVMHGTDATELFDIEVDEIAWVLALIASDRFSWL
jgi:hypothetical protein